MDIKPKKINVSSGEDAFVDSDFQPFQHDHTQNHQEIRH